MPLVMGVNTYRSDEDMSESHLPPLEIEHEMYVD